MPLDKETEARWTRLQAFFDSESWEDLKVEIGLCYRNADNILKSQECEKREFFAGKCSGHQDVLNLKAKCQVK